MIQGELYLDRSSSTSPALLKRGKRPNSDSLNLSPKDADLHMPSANMLTNVIDGTSYAGTLMKRS